MKKFLALASIALLAASLTACSDDGGGDSATDADYCDLIQDAKDEYDDLDFTGMSQEDFDGFQSAVEEIQAAAPDEVEDQWGVLSDATQRLQELLTDAGISLDDLSAMQSGEIPEGVDVGELQSLMTEFQNFTEDSSFEDAAQEVQQNVRDECDIDL